MALNNTKHTISEIGGIRCSIVETGTSPERLGFLKDLLEFNGYEVKSEEEKKKTEDAPTTFIIGVTNILFNPVTQVYMKKLKTREGYLVTPNYWEQKGIETEIPYWTVISDTMKALYTSNRFTEETPAADGFHRSLK
jgi:hypothetical protein